MNSHVQFTKDSSIKKYRCNSTGNSIFRQCKRSKIDAISIKNHQITDFEIVRVVTNPPYQNCCKDGNNCLLQTFKSGPTIDWKSVIQLYRNCKQEFQFMSIQEKRLFEANQFQKSSYIKGSKIAHNWCVGNIKVCSTTFRSVFEISSYKMENLSRYFKKGEILEQHVVDPSTRQKCTDSTIPNISFNQVNNLFQENLSYSGTRII